MRRLVKALALTVALLVLITGLAIAVFFSLSDAQHRWIATHVVSALLDSPVEFRGSFSLDLGRPSTFTAKDIWIGVGPDGRSLGAPVEGRLGVVQLRVDPVALLRGTVLIHRLVVESAEIELAPPEQDKTQAGKSWRERLRALERGPVLFLETARLSDIRVTRRAGPGASPFFLKLEDVSLEDEGGVDGRILLNGAITVDDHPLALQGEFGSLAAALDPLTPYPSRLSILHPVFAATLDGYIEDPLGARGLDLRSRLEVPDLEALGDVIPQYSWPAGRISIASEVSGSIEDLRLGELIIDFSDTEGRSVKVSGAIADALELREASLDLTARLPQAQVLLNRFLETDLPALNEVSLEARLVAEDRSWRAEGLDVRIAADAGWSLAGSGAAVLDAGDDGLALDSLALDLDISAPDTAAFSSLIRRKIASLGPVAVVGALSSDGDSLELADLSYQVGDQGRLLVTGTGRIDLSDLYETPDGEMFDRIDIDLSAEVEAPGEELARMLLERDLPDPGPLSAAFRVTGNGRQLRLVPQALAFDGASGSTLRLGPVDEDSGLTLVLGKPLEIRDMRVPLLAAVPGTAALRPWLGDRYLPDLGEMAGRGVLVGGGRNFGLHDIVLSEGPESRPRIEASGRIDVEGRKQIDLTADFRADLATLANPFLTVPLQPLGGAKGHLELSNVDGSLGIETLEIATIRDGDAYLRLSGVIDDILHFAEIDLTVDARLARLELIRQAFEPDWDETDKSAFWQQSASFEGRFLATESTRFASLEGSGNLGGGGLIADLRLHDLDTRPAIVGAVSLSELNLSDFGIHLRGEGEKPDGAGPKRLFPETPLGLSRLEEATLDLTISVDDIIDPLVSLQKIDTRLVWNEKRFALQPTVFVYEGGHVNLVLSIDFTQDPPEHRLLIVANDMNLGNFLSRFREGKPLVEGKLTLDAGLEARGESAHEIASSLSGDMALALEEGRLNHVNLRLLAPRTFQWFTAATGGQSYTILSCVIAPFDVAEGVAKSDNLYVRAPDVRLTGAGSIDFGKEELDIVLAAPRPALAPPGLEKPVRFHGNLADPKVQASATGHAANLGIATAGVVLMPMLFVPWLAASAMFSQLDEEGEDSPCLIDPEAAQDEDSSTVSTGQWVGKDDGWTLTFNVEERKVRGNIEHKKGDTKISGRVSGKIRSDGVFEGWTLGRQVGGRKIYGRMPELDMWGGEKGDAARFTMKATGPQAED